MGVTIYYRGRLASLDHLEPCIQELTEIARTLKWECQLYDGNEPDIAAVLPLKGLCINLHPKSEHLCICFDPDGILRHPLSVRFDNLKNPVSGKDLHVFVKTHFAPVEIHIVVIKLLRYLKQRYIPNLEVSDEAGYWETDDLEALMQFWGEVEDEDSTVYPPEIMLSMLDNLFRHQKRQQR